ncbi:MAG TPA: LysM peptidoglycan-binding domain-containing protein [Bacillus sp. (in: firmicutes)]|nr:LysM peptidoglycan-binding domain-containing protein [Bacillus sp. (in: firmicutes)]
MKKNKFNLLKIAALTLGLSAAFGHIQGEAATTYEVKKGDTLYRIAKNNHLTVSQLMQLNNLSSTTIYIGDKLFLSPAITIQKGDTLYSLAKKYHTTISYLKMINHLTSDTIYAGQKLVVPSHITVKKGDTLYRIAKNFGLTVQELKSLNGLTSDTIYAGQTLTVLKNKALEPYDAEKIKVEVNTKKGFTFASEEPRKFVLQYTNDDSYFTRIEVLDSKATTNDVKRNSMDYLKGNKISEYETDHSYHPFYSNAAFFLHGSNSQTQTNIVVKEMDGKLVRFTIHYLNKEESEGIVPTMVDILHTTKLK